MTWLILSQPSEDYAAALSSALYRLSAHPSSLGTAYAVGWQTNPVTGQVGLHVSGDQYLQPDADIAAFVALLQITDDEAAALTADLDARRGTRVGYADMLPPSLQDGMVTRFMPVDLNRDEADTLRTLNGVDVVRAEAIIDGRVWDDPADLSHIDGISAAMVAEWQAAPGLVT